MSKGNRGGRPAKPTALHKLEGTYNPSRHGRQRAGEPKPVGDLRTPPAYLNASQKAGWKYAIDNAPPYLLKRLDKGMLALWCIHEDNMRLAVMTQNRLNARSPDLPLLVKTSLGTAVSPYVDVLDKASRHMFRAATELGFSPAARPRIRLDEMPPDKPVESDRWGELKLIDGGKKK